MLVRKGGITREVDETRLQEYREKGYCAPKAEEPKPEQPKAEPPKAKPKKE